MDISKDTYRQIFDSISSPVLILCHNGIIRHLNRSASKLIESTEGISPEPGITLAPTWLQQELENLLKSGVQQLQASRRIIPACNSLYLQINLTSTECDSTPAVVAELSDLSRLHLMEDGLRELVEGVSEATGDAFFQFLVLHLARAVDADFAFIGEFANQERTKIKTVAVCADTHLQSNFSFELAGTPCEEVITSGLRSYPENLATLFPNDRIGIQMGVNSYIGLPLTNSKGITLGFMAIMSRRRIPEQHLAESMLQVFAARAAAELDRKRSETSLRETETRLKTIVNSVHTGIMVIDPRSHQIVDANEVAAASIGRKREEMLGLPCKSVICACLGGKCPIIDLESEIDNKEHELLKADGTILPVILTISKVLLDGREFLLESFVDISHRKESEKALKESEERYRMLVENQSDLVVKTDLKGSLLFVSPSFCNLFGLGEKELLGRPLQEIITSDRTEVEQEGLSDFVANETSCYREYLTRTINGDHWIGWALRCVYGPTGEPEAIVGMGRDISDRKTAEQTIEKLAYHDPLTGLPNRALLYDRLKLAISQSSRDNKGSAILFLDLDRFKAINDSMGHSGGDELLLQVGQRLLNCVRSSDTVARLGGDEFVVLLSTLENDHAAGIVVLKILETLAEPFFIANQEIYNSASIGIALYPRDGQDPETLLKNADMAMYQAKEGGRNTCHFFSQELNQRTTERILLESTLRKALEHKEFFLVYQPQMELSTGHVTGTEALVRWRHPELGIVPPDRFIPIAEDTGLIIALGEWVLREACKQAKLWMDEGHKTPRIGVNVSAKQFRQKNLAGKIGEILEETGLPHHMLELELTESSVMENPEEAILTLRQLKQMGIQLSIDDFGTGYSSLSYLKHFPIDRLKIDRSFMRHITNNLNDATIAEAIIALAHSMKLTVVAEGVEHMEQLDFISLRKCDVMQGYYLSRPVPAGEFGIFLTRLHESGGKAHDLLGI